MATATIRTERVPRILIVDDDDHNHNVLALMLADEGYSLQRGRSGGEALELIATGPPDLVLLDVLMPGMDGIEVTGRIKNDPRTTNIPVILVTALDDRESRLRGLEAGAEDFLSKPVERAELCVRIRNLLRLQSAISVADDARVEADRANRAKTDVLHAISHDLRTPIGAISGYAHLIGMGVRGPVNAEQATDLDRIKNAAAYLLRLIDDVLMVARMESDRPLRLEPVDLSELLDDVRGLCVLQAESQGLALLTARAVGARATADRERLQQILLNLITNAIKFSSPGGTITVSCDRIEELTCVRVSDTGRGIDPLDLERVFEPFFQIDPVQTSSAAKGVGLGLSISRELARAMHGDLTVHSAIGLGSTFTLSLPTATIPGAADGSADGSAHSGESVELLGLGRDRREHDTARGGP
jgi:two-component system sensor histidine kinase/response regulator